MNVKRTWALTFKLLREKLYTANGDGRVVCKVKLQHRIFISISHFKQNAVPNMQGSCFYGVWKRCLVNSLRKELQDGNSLSKQGVGRILIQNFCRIDNWQFCHDKITVDLNKGVLPQQLPTYFGHKSPIHWFKRLQVVDQCFV